FTLIETMMPS
ncbi:lysR substrate binding domain protein, partial [Vibrio parahaemolyticus V-223/04]